MDRAFALAETEQKATVAAPSAATHAAGRAAAWLRPFGHAPRYQVGDPCRCSRGRIDFKHGPPERRSVRGIHSAQCAGRSGSPAAEGRRVNPVVRRDGSQRAQEMIVFCVRADPEPNDDIAFDDAECAMPEPHPCGVDRPGRVHEFEAETSVLRVLLETPVGFTSPALNMVG